MSFAQPTIAIAVLDDYQGVALRMADWSAVLRRAEVTVFRDHLEEPEALVRRLQGFDALCIMRERTPLPRSILARLPRLKLIVSTGARNASIDGLAAQELGIAVLNTGYTSSPTIELTWALILAGARHLASESGSLRYGGWQRSVGDDLSGHTLGIVGLGRIGTQVARIGQAFGMQIIAWSQNLTPQHAAAAGATAVSKQELFRQADVVSIHVILSDRTRGLVGAAELALMKPSARLVNTSRGPIVVEADLLAALASRRIAGAAIDVFDIEPLPPEHPCRTADRLLATPHIGYVSRGTYERFYGDTVAHLAAWLDGLGARNLDAPP
jgi:phosphoglycerate dehydrogenase-like enzyme